MTEKYKGMPLTDWLEWPPQSDGVWELGWEDEEDEVDWGDGDDDRAFVRTKGNLRSRVVWQGNDSIEETVERAGRCIVSRRISIDPRWRYRGLAVDPKAEAKR